MSVCPTSGDGNFYYLVKMVFSNFLHSEVHLYLKLIN